MSNIQNNLSLIKQRIDAAAQKALRDADSVKLIAVSKLQSIAAIEEALCSGQMCFGENRVQEAESKFTALRVQYPAIELHLIGALQTNKAEDAVKVFDVIQTLDRLSLAAALAKAMQKTGRNPKLYIQVNVGNESQKSGIASQALESFLYECRDVHGLIISGLMCIPPQNTDPTPYFRQLKQCADHYNLPHISMGMSADFEAAIACGATEVRVGTAVFGGR